MKYISIDIETCGLESEEHSLVQFGAIIEDTSNKLSFESIPKFETLIEYPLYKGTPFALAMHAKLFAEIAKPEEERTSLVCKHWELAEKFYEFLNANDFGGTTSFKGTPIPIKINVAGKNFGTFDKKFLDNLPNWEKFIKISQRILDPAILFWEPLKDEALPNLSECKKRAEFSDIQVAHTTLEDAWDVIQLLRTKY